MADIVPGEPLEHAARTRPHQGQHGVGGGHIDQARIEFGWELARDPVEIMSGEAGARDDVVGVPLEPPHGQIAFDAAPGIEHLRIDETADGPCDLVGADPAQGALSVGPDELEFGK